MKSLGELLGGMRLTQSGPVQAYDYGPWFAAPQKVGALEHAEWCSDGVLEVEGEYKSCPVCAYRKRMEGLKRRMMDAGIGERYLNTSWEDLEIIPPLDKLQARSEALRDVLPGGVRAGHNALLWGPPGSGKTQSGVLLAVRALQLGHSARIANLGRLCTEVRSAYDKEGLTETGAIEALAKPDLLVLDDLGAGETAAQSLETRLLYLALEERHNAQKPTIITSNLEPSQIAGYFGTRVLHRLMPLAVVHFAHGQNFRRADVSFWD